MKKNCLYKYERYKERKNQSVKPPHKHIKIIRDIREKFLKNTYYLLHLLHTSHTTLHT